MGLLHIYWIRSVQRDDIAQLLLYASVLWPRTFVAPASDAELQVVESVWMDVLGFLPLAELRRAMVQWTGHWPPTPQELRSVVLENMAPIPDYTQALSEIAAEVRRVGWIGQPEFSHKAIAEAVVGMGGWLAVCTSENPETFRAQFRDIYKTVAQRAAVTRLELFQGAAPELALQGQGELHE